MSNFFGFPKPRKAGFGSPDIPSVDIPPMDTTLEDVVLEGVIVDFGDIEPRPGVFDPFAIVTDPNAEDINSFLRRMLGVNSPVADIQDEASGPVLVDIDTVADMLKDKGDKSPESSAESAESVEDMLNVMGSENEKLQNFIADAMKNMKK